MVSRLGRHSLPLGGEGSYENEKLNKTNIDYVRRIGN